MEHAARHLSARGPRLPDVPQRGGGTPVLCFPGHGILGDGAAAATSLRRRGCPIE